MKVRNATRWLAVLVVVGFSACGGGGGGGGSAPPSSTPQLAASKLFVADGGNHAIGSQVNPNPGPGTFAVDRIISGPATGLGSGGTPSPSTIPSIALDVGADQLYAATQGNVRVFNQASLASGNVAPSRTFSASVIKNSVLHGVNFFQLFLDAANNRLYVADIDGFLFAFENASGLNGAAVPGRTIQIDLGGAQVIGTFGVAVDTTVDNLFVGIYGNGFTNMLIFNNQSGKSGLRAPDQTLSFSFGPNSFYLDRVNNRLYVLLNGSIQVFNNANSLTTGTPTPSRTITLSALSTTVQPSVFVDTASDRLYAAGNNLVFIVPNASTVTGTPSTFTQVTLPDANARFSGIVTKP